MAALVQLRKEMIEEAVKMSNENPEKFYIIERLLRSMSSELSDLADLYGKGLGAWRKLPR